MPLLECQDVHVTYGKGSHALHAVKGVSLDVEPGEIVGLVGESGCGKSSLGRAAIGLTAMSGGSILFEGVSVDQVSKLEQKKIRRNMQMIFQDPYGSLNPRLQIGSALLDVMEVHSIGSNKQERLDRAVELLKAVDLPSNSIGRYPHEFSGGQRQRICIARALTLEPSLVIADEPVSALDVSVQSEILELLESLRQERQLAFLFISHDLAVVRNLCDRVAVMFNGTLVETGRVEEVIDRPQHAYTQKLLDAVPVF
ncbi:MAG: ATP-binding cassette domain-containing protein [Pontiellaceae bacterium]